jgi:hypothetical protein
MKRESTKHKGIYKVGETYYITYYVGVKKYEKAIGSKLFIALKEKMERENRGKRGNYEVLERQEKTSFKQLVDLYEKEGDGKKYILQFLSTYLKRPLQIQGCFEGNPETERKKRSHRLQCQSGIGRVKKALQFCGVQGIP